jgi:hypothetical protein
MASAPILASFGSFAKTVPTTGTTETETLTNKTIGETANTLNSVLASASILHAPEFGILPTNSATTNNTGFAAMKAVMQAGPTTVWHLIFEPSAYTYATAASTRANLSVATAGVVDIWALLSVNDH